MLNTNIPPIPIALSDSAERQVEIAEDVAALLELPGWGHLKAALAEYQCLVSAQLMGISGSSEPAKYADLTGQMIALGRIEAVARGVIEVGDQAKAQTREAEIKEES